MTKNNLFHYDMIVGVYRKMFSLIYFVNLSLLYLFLVCGIYLR